MPAAAVSQSLTRTAFEPTPEQRQVLEHEPNRHGVILAGPGTGKSATVVALIDELARRTPAPRVRLVTFTRAATSELATKVSEPPAVAAQRPSTIHSFAISVLLMNPGAARFPGTLRMADEWEYKEIVRPTRARRMDIGLRLIDLLMREMGLLCRFRGSIQDWLRGGKGQAHAGLPALRSRRPAAPHDPHLK
jgi:superfamily I DNA/RNA helicase